MKLSKKFWMGLTLLTCTILGLAYAETQWHIISDIFQGQTAASNSLLHIYPCSLTPFPDNVQTGTPFEILIDVDNPNLETVNGRMMINFTRNAMAINDVSVTTNATYSGFPVSVTSEGIVGNTSVFSIKVDNAADPYFHFNPGQNVDITYIFIQYNTEGTYGYALAVVS